MSKKISKTEDKRFEFAFSLDILNHLGRGLYRSFATVIAEAVSNSWDAEATEVDIKMDKKSLIVDDNGKGMDDLDFQNKFLKVGYSRRLDRNNKSKRNVIGRKGIGKLAMLSVSEKVTIIAKKKASALTGGRINNPELDEKIRSEGNYSLDVLTVTDKRRFARSKKTSGTRIIFEKIKINLNSESIIRKYLATQFNFIFSLKKGDKFKIVVNGTPITRKDLKELDDNTQFIWFLGKEDKDRLELYENLDEHRVIEDNTFEFDGKTIEIRGFIASVKFPKDLILRGSEGDFKASINLFCNGRLRQEDLFQEISLKRLAEEYLYGEVHVDGLEDEKIDRFTSSREGIIKDDPLYQSLLKKLRKIQTAVLTDWDPWRRKHKNEGDIEDESLPKYQRRLEDSKNWREKDFEEKLDASLIDKAAKEDLKSKLRNLSYKNTSVYQDLFILENIFREYIKFKNIDESIFDQSDADQKDLADKIKGTRKSRNDDESTHALKGKIVKEESYLNYADLYCLASIIDVWSNKNAKKPTLKKYRKELCSDVKEINPIRNPIMHTNEITDEVMKWNKIKNLIDYIDKLKDKKRI